MKKLLFFIALLATPAIARALDSPFDVAYSTKSPFGPRIHPRDLVWKLHAGVDFSASLGLGTTIYAVEAGTITDISSIDKYGIVVTVESEQRTWYYAHTFQQETDHKLGGFHLRKPNPNVNAYEIDRSTIGTWNPRTLLVDSFVNLGEPIAPMGYTDAGDPTNAHLHLALNSYLTKPPDYLPIDNPLTYMSHVAAPYQFNLTASHPTQGGVVYATVTGQEFPFVVDVDMTGSMDLDKLYMFLDGQPVNGSAGPTFSFGGVPGEAAVNLSSASNNWDYATLDRVRTGVDPIRINGDTFRRQFVYRADISTLTEGEHILTYAAKSADGLTETTTGYAFLVNSKLPFLKNIQVNRLNDGEIFYNAAWNLNGTNYELTVASSAVIRSTGVYTITLTFSEPVETALSLNLGKVGNIALASAQPQGQRTVWTGSFTLPEGQNESNGTNVLEVTAQDLAGTELALLSTATGNSFPVSQLARDAGGNFTGPMGADTRHEINIQIEGTDEEQVIANVSSWIDMDLRSTNGAGIAYIEQNALGIDVIRVKQMDGPLQTLAPGVRFQGFRGPPHIAYGVEDEPSTAYVVYNTSTRKYEVRYDGSGPADRRLSNGLRPFPIR